MNSYKRYRVWTPTTHGKTSNSTFPKRWQARLHAWWHDMGLPRDSLFRGATIEEETVVLSMERWDSQPERRRVNDGRGMCNTGANHPGICSLNGIGCNVDHAWIQAQK